MKVVKLAQPGYDVKTAADANLIYNSNWPLLKIVKSGSFTIEDNGELQVIHKHGLGFKPMYWTYSNVPVEIYSLLFSDVNPVDRSEYQGIGGTGLAIDEDKLFVQRAAGLFTGAVQIQYYIFALDLEKPYIAPSFDLGNQSATGSGGPAFKIAQPNKSIESDDLADYVIHSDTRSPLIHSVNLMETELTSPGNFTAVVYHNLGYIPMAFTFRKRRNVFPGSFDDIFTGAGASIQVNIDHEKLTLRSTSDITVTAVILKDPFDIDYSVRVSV